ncbi:indolepyruvate ferredoxin oxidoreductase family protein [Corynebacterium sp. 4HC-13]|uniref:indolepyruvate ferredoxin oxidoreductase family protein n=1 Tax=Corynebacterium anserum TaxID=2684406 RepID=UPI00163AFB0C|nr:indolepyruvate ferredoxin oxidoreductase family protein [Corynebacterium anserum]MBC2681574.1 indolepyruvate ferredoxin oxidoreductase family protein [Corynebacterium anserum]
MTSTMNPSTTGTFKDSHYERSPRSVEDLLTRRYTARQGSVHLTGIQALIRMISDRQRADAARGLRTASYVSGYEGSPLAGYDLELSRQKKLLEDHRIFHQPGVNEELAATAVEGTQLTAAATLKDDIDGVVGYWYGKAPGLDRAADAMRHAVICGTNGKGGAVAIVGDDPTAKSSSVPSNSSRLLADLGMPTLVPTDASDVLSLGTHAAWMSRATGLWVALRVTTAVADGSATVVLDDVTAPEPPTTPHTPHAKVLGQPLLALDASRTGERLNRAIAYAREHHINRLVQASPDDEIGIIASGATYLEVAQALRTLGAGQCPPRIRLLRLGMTYPLDSAELSEFAAGLKKIVVAEDLGTYLVESVRTVLYGTSHRPDIIHTTAPEKLLPRLLKDEGIDIMETKNPPRLMNLPLAVAPRTPHFCSGCPHNASTRTSPDTLVGAGIGCHAMVLLMDDQRVGNVIGTAQMGGEGGHWIGMSPFVKEKHLVQNLGDGTFWHSGSLAIRALIASDVNVTVKLLHNGTVAMTGGQDAVGGRGLRSIVDMLQAEGVGKIVVTSDNVSRTRKMLPRGVEVRERSELAAVQEELAAIKGVTVLVHDQHCAAEKRRFRNRGQAEKPKTAVEINPRICEGCGDCGEKSGCLSVQPIDTDFGRKTKIDQTSCNSDYTCLQGDCPAFVTVTPGASDIRATAQSSPIGMEHQIHAADLPEPTMTPLADRQAHSVRITGVGGTGVLTVAAVLATAAQHEGYFVRGQDMTGLAQKGGSVISDVRLSTSFMDHPGHIPAAGADVLLSLDGLTSAADETLEVLNPERTIAVISTTDQPTGKMVTDVRAERTNSALISRALSSRVQRAISADAGDLSTQLFGVATYQTMIVLGAAIQAGAIPVSAAAIERALRANGRSSELNVQALRRGRQLIAAPQELERLLAQPQGVESMESTVTVPRANNEEPLWKTDMDMRAQELEAWGNAAVACRYKEDVRRIAEAERRIDPRSTELALAAAFGLHKLQAYKDEYEVARLAADPAFAQDIERRYGAGASTKIQLHPPILRAMGLKKKIGVSTRFMPALKVLAAGKRLRGTSLDIFGYTKQRRVERELAEEYRNVLLRRSAEMSSAEDLASLVELAREADSVRGYEELKINSALRLLALLREPDRRSH